MYKLELRNRKSIRLKQYDYSSQGMYFITICVKNRECILSKINCKQGVGVDDHVDPIKLQTCGKIVQEKIKNINYAYENVMVNQYVIMPNHIHMLIEIKEKDRKNGSMRASTPTIPQIVNALKGLITKQIGFSIFQRNYYEHIVRNEKEYLKIQEYIKNNPLNWEEDELNM